MIDPVNYSKPLAIAALAVFGLIAVVFTVRIFLSKSSRFLYLLSVTAVWECTGYAVRILCTDSIDLNKFVVMTLFLLLPPNALALVNYKAVGEVIRLSNVESKHFYLRPKFVTWFFFSSDVFSLVCQGAGGALQASGTSDTIGIAITLVGLCAQLVFFTCFAWITHYVHRRPEYTYQVEGMENPKKNLVFCLVITLAFLYVRSIYRIAEYATGYGGPIAKLEWAFYLFDTLIIIACFLVYTIYFIGNYLPKRGEGYYGDDNATKLPSLVENTSLDSLNRLENGKMEMQKIENLNNRQQSGNTSTF